MGRQRKEDPQSFLSNPRHGGEEQENTADLDLRPLYTCARVCIHVYVYMYTSLPHILKLKIRENQPSGSPFFEVVLWRGFHGLSLTLKSGDESSCGLFKLKEGKILVIAIRSLHITDVHQFITADPTAGRAIVCQLKGTEEI